MGVSVMFGENPWLSDGSVETTGIDGQNPLHGEREERSVTLLSHPLFHIGLFMELPLGSVGLFWIVYLTVFGGIYYAMPFDWTFYEIWGVERIPFLLGAEYLGLVAAGFTALFLLMRLVLPSSPEEERNVKLRYAIAMAEVGPLMLILIALIMWYDNYVRYALGLHTMLITNFLEIPLTGVCLGAALGRLAAVGWTERRWDRTVIILERKRQGEKGWRRLLLPASLRTALRTKEKQALYRAFPILLWASESLLITGGIIAFVIGYMIVFTGQMLSKVDPYIGGLMVSGGLRYQGLGVLMLAVFFITVVTVLIPRPNWYTRRVWMLGVSGIAVVLISLILWNLTLVPLFGLAGGILLLIAAGTAFKERKEGGGG